MLNPLVKLGLSIGVLATAFAGGIYLGNAKKETALPPAPEFAFEEKTMLSPEEVVEINLKPADVPSHYFPIEEKSGLLDDALLYVGGNLESAQAIKNAGWLAVAEAYYETAAQEGVASNSIYSALSTYEKVELLDCLHQRVALNFANQGGKLLATSHPFGDWNVLFLVLMEEPGVGQFPVYQLRFRHGNVMVNLEVGGPEGSVSQEEVESYGTLIEQRLKESCPNCVRAPLCPT